MKALTFGEIMLRLKAPGHERFFQSPMLEATFGGGYGAEVRFSGTSIVQVRLVLRAYTLTTQTLSVLPPAQAAAVLPEGSALRLVYSDTSAGITAGWQS